MRWPTSLPAPGRLRRRSAAPSVALLAPAARLPVSRYLDAFSAALPAAASARRRADVVTEIGDGLVDDTAARIDRGVPPGQAARAAIAAFGDPDQVARACAGELAAAAAHRTGTALVLTGPVVGLGWLLATSATDPVGALDALWGRVPAYPVILLIAVPAAVLAATMTGRRVGWLRSRTSVALRAAVAAGLGCALGDVLLIGTALHDGAAGPALLAAAGSGLRLGLVTTAALRCARLLTAVA